MSSLTRNLFTDREECYCAFCKTPRTVYLKKNINLFNIFASAAGAGILMYTIWQEFDPRVCLLFVAFLAVSEIFVQIRWRLTIVCRQCGFDPVLYVKEPQLAAAKVKAQLARRKEDPRFILSRPLNLPVVSKATIEEAEKKQRLEQENIKKNKTSRLLSKQV